MPADLRYKSRRRGFTLLEIVAVGAILTGIAFAALRLLDGVDRLQRSMQQDAQSVRDLQRFADRFRADLASAEAVASDAARQAIELTMPKERPPVRYEVVDRVVRRREGGPAAEGRTRAIDGYRLPPGSQASWETAQDLRVVGLEITSSNNRFPRFAIEGIVSAEVTP